MAPAGLSRGRGGRDGDGGGGTGPSFAPLTPAEERLYEGQPKGFPLGGFDLDDVMLPEGEDMGIPSGDDDGGDDEEGPETGFGRVIVVDNLPQVPPEKFDKLCAVVKKVLSAVGRIKSDSDGSSGLTMPVDENTKLSKGFAFVEFETPAEAAAAVAHANGYKLDKAHALAVNGFDDVARFQAVPDTYEAPPPRAFEPGPNLQGWMLDRRGRDQFVARFGDETEVSWNDAPRLTSEVAHSRPFWSDRFVLWSPRGSFLATVHRQGVALWGGPEFVRLRRFAHAGVQRVDFSPAEKYLVTYSAAEPAHPREKPRVTINFFCVRTGRKLRTFEGGADEFAIGSSQAPGGGPAWPLFKWAGSAPGTPRADEDRFVARLGKGAVSVYECPGMGLLDKKSLKLEGVVDFQWSPSAPILFTYQAGNEQQQTPARIALTRIPDRVELRQKQLFSVSRVRGYWHPKGRYLAVEVARFTKTRKSTYTNLELFTFDDALVAAASSSSSGGASASVSASAASVPMEVLDLAKTEALVDFGWEPSGTRFGVLHVSESSGGGGGGHGGGGGGHGGGPGGGKPTFSIYDMAGSSKAGVSGVALACSLPGQQANALFWSPSGRFVLLAGLKNMNGQLSFVDADAGDALSAGEHFMATDVSWDPTGRYVATSVTSVHQMENGYKVWAFNGRPLYSAAKECFYQFLWRPRPPTLLSPEAEKAIERNLKKYARKYEEEDAALLHEADAEIVAERRAAMESWRSWRASREEYARWLAAEKVRVLGEERAREKEFEIATVEVEEAVDSREEVVQPGEL